MSPAQTPTSVPAPTPAPVSAQDRGWVWAWVVRADVFWCAVGIAVLVPLYGLTFLRTGLVLWADAMTGTSTATLVINPLVAGAFCLARSRQRQRGEAWRHRLSVRGPGAVTVWTWVRWWAWVLTGYLAGFVVLAAVMSARGADGAPSGWWITAMVAGTTVCAAFGFTLGRWLSRWWLTSLAVTFLVYLGWAAVNLWPGSTQLAHRFYPSSTAQVTEFSTYLPATFAAQALWFTGLAVLVICCGIAFTGVRARWVPVAAVVAAVVVAATGARMLVGTGGQVSVAVADPQRVCTGQQVNVCVHPTFAPALPELEDAFTGLAEKTSGSYLEPTALGHSVPGPGEDPGAGRRALTLYDLSPGVGSQALIAYVQTYGGIRQCTGSEDSNWMVLLVDDWLTDGPEEFVGIPGAVGEAAQRFESWSPGQRHQWFLDHARDYQQCRLGPGDVQVTR